MLMKTVLLVDDDPEDVLFMKRACKAADIPHSLVVLTDGEAAVDYLSQCHAESVSNPLPTLLFLDIKLPLGSGHEVLQWVRSQSHLKNMPVVMLTGSPLNSDVELAYESGATSYLAKTSNVTALCAGVKTILSYWLQLNVPRVP